MEWIKHHNMCERFKKQGLKELARWHYRMALKLYKMYKEESNA